ncbi:hypothetical protein Syun_030693 [Stephania yunnanensis]|uniref:Uncharacterized protein n=1 Tax=Stephania yunnanensis TaxID=152371 RepID=A0AAP0HAE5_9MAGN
MERSMFLVHYGKIKQCTRIEEDLLSLIDEEESNALFEADHDEGRDTSMMERARCVFDPQESVSDPKSVDRLSFTLKVLAPQQHDMSKLSWVAGKPSNIQILVDSEGSEYRWLAFSCWMMHTRVSYAHATNERNVEACLRMFA